MHSTLQSDWQRRRHFSSFCRTPRFGDDGLLLGAGTYILRFDRGEARSSSAARERLVALLAVAARGQLSSHAFLQLDAALHDWRRGDKALAAIRLAFAPLPRLNDATDAYPLFLAECALDAGLSPKELLRELGYADGIGPLLKFDPNQLRVPSGHGRTSGRWTSGDGSTDDAGAAVVVGANRTPDRRAPETDDHQALVVPVFDPGIGAHDLLDGKTEPQDEVVPQHELGPLSDSPTQLNAFPNPRAEIEPTPQPAPRSTPVAPKAGSGESDEDAPDVPLCLPQPDVPHGASPLAEQYEYDMAQQINPDDPTFKRRPGDPKVPPSMAYFLFSPDASGFVSFDDCKKTDVPSRLIPQMKKGDMAEYKNDNFFIPLVPNAKGYAPFEKQIARQNNAVEAEGKGRQMFHCYGSRLIADAVRDRFQGKYRSSKFIYCPSRTRGP